MDGVVQREIDLELPTDAIDAGSHGDIIRADLKFKEFPGRFWMLVGMPGLEEAIGASRASSRSNVDSRVFAASGSNFGECAVGSAICGGMAWLARREICRRAGGGGRNFVQDLLSIKRQRGLGDIAAGSRS